MTPLAEDIVSCLEGNISTLEKNILADLYDSPYEFGFGILLQDSVFNVGMSVSESCYYQEKDNKVRWYFPFETLESKDLEVILNYDLESLEEWAKEGIDRTLQYTKSQISFFENLISGLKEELSILEA